MRLRQLGLGLVALGGLWLSVMIVRTQGPAPVRIVAERPPSVLATYAPAAKVSAAAAPARPAPVQAPSSTVTVSADPAATAQVEIEPEPTAVVEVSPDTSVSANAPVEEPLEGSAPRVSADTPPPPPEALAISDAQVVSVSASSARIRWRTNLPAQALTAFGLDAPTIWAQSAGSDPLQHESVLDGLSFATTYRVWLHAVDEWNRAETTEVSFTTGPMGGPSFARASGDRLLVDDQPVFPRAVWAQCSDGFDGNIADGINLFMGDGCEDEHRLPGRLAGRAYSIVDAKDANVSGRGVIGWYYQDEWDAFLESRVTRADLEPAVPKAPAGRLGFLTLTNHFYSRAAPLPQGKGMYPALLSIADVVGFDLYPLQVWCRPAFGDVFDSQRELHDVSGGKPTFQWIEVARMEQPCRTNPELDPTPPTVRAETWLAIAGGADGIGYFPNHWARDIGAEVARTNRQIQALAPALLASPLEASSDSGAVRVSARELNGALYVIAVNSAAASVQAKISLAGIAGRSVTNLFEGSAVGADDTGFVDTFEPLAARVYVVPPRGW